MTLHPDMKAVLEAYDKVGRPDFPAMGAAGAKEYARASAAGMGTGPEIGEVRDLQIAGGAGPIGARLYAPEGEAIGLLIFFHGGGWVLGTLDSYDAVLRRLARSASIRILSIDYRLAPEHRFPAAIEDCIAAVDWAGRHAAEVGAAGLPIAVGGDSAGGNLAAAAALHYRDAGGTPLAFQLLIYPNVDADFNRPSYTAHANSGLLSSTAMRWFWDQYVPLAEDRAHVLASPLRAESLAGVAPALVELAGYDPLFSEGEAYVERLNRDGVSVSVRYRPGLSHGYFQMAEVLPPAGEALLETAGDVRAQFLRRNPAQ